LQKSGPGFKIKVKPGSSAKPALNLLKTGVWEKNLSKWAKI
jgi:hypothetical protein